MNAFSMDRKLIPYFGNQRPTLNQMANPFSMSPFGGFDYIGNMFNNMNNNFMSMPCNGFSSSSFVSYSSNGSRPYVYQEKQITRVGPNGVKEIQKIVKDSHRGQEKRIMQQHIGEKAHIIEKNKNFNTGEEEDKEELINIDENELPQFNQQWNIYSGKRPHIHAIDNKKSLTKPKSSNFKHVCTRKQKSRK